MLLLEDKLTKVYEAIRKSDINFNEFGPSTDEYEIEDSIQVILEDAGIDGYVTSGASKLAIVISGCSKVIKIPFNGYYEEEWDDDEYMGEYFCEFRDANDLHLEDASCWDYCANELAKYEIAEEAGYAPLFAKTEKLGVIRNHPIYAQERVYVYDENNSAKFKKNYTLEERQNYRDYSNSLYYDKEIDVYFGINFGILLFQTYGARMFENICQFLSANKMHRDLHSGNVGFTMSGRPIILDFSGWRD